MIKLTLKAIGILLFIGAIGLGFKAIFLPANLAIERMAITHSYQYKAGMESRAAILRANIIEIDAMLDAGVGNPKALNAQRRGLNAQLTATYK